MAKPAKAPSRADNPDRWMISYADLLTLTLAFFIVMYAQSTVNVAKLEQLASAIAIAFHGTPSVLTSKAHGASGILSHPRAAVKPPVPAAPPRSALNPELLRSLSARAGALRAAAAELERVLRPLLAVQKVRLEESALSLRISLNAQVLFRNGEATLQPSAQKLLIQIAGIIRGIPPNYPVVVQGYTNKIPIATTEFPSNWELSAARAISVVHLFMGEHIPGTQLSVQGFAQYHPLKSVTGAQAVRENRRVEILILAPSAQALGAAGTGAAAVDTPDGQRVEPPKGP